VGSSQAVSTALPNAYGDTSPVDSLPNGVSITGASDLAGNVAEWVSDWYQVDYYASAPRRDPRGPTDGTAKVVRGGSFLDPAVGIRGAARAFEIPAADSSRIGFRCAKDGQ
jgi:formylglycine-generating enzyme required for sulfatase activity